jgi:hemoglobin
LQIKNKKMNKKDLENREDIEKVVVSFYSKIRSEATLGYIFNDIAHVDWDKHLPKMFAFWDMILFNKEEYEGHPLKPHLIINNKYQLTAEHFGIWIGLFTDTVDDLYTGPKAEEIKLRATNIALTWASKFEYLNK